MCIQAPETVDFRKYVATLAHNARSQNWNITELAYQFTLSEAQVLAAFLYYGEYKAEIEAQKAAYQMKLDDAYNQYGAKDQLL